MRKDCITAILSCFFLKLAVTQKETLAAAAVVVAFVAPTVLLFARHRDGKEMGNDSY